MKTISQISPQRRLLNFQQLTPAKVNVGCQINGWLQTYKKSDKKQIKRNHRKYVPKSLYQQNMEDIQLSMKMIKAKYLENNPHLVTITKQKIQQALSTKCKTSEIRGRSNRKFSIPEIQISNFDADEQQENIKQQKNVNKVGEPLNKFNHFLQIKEVMSNDYTSHKTPVSLTDRLQQRAKRMNKLLSYSKVRNNSKGTQNTMNFNKKVQLINKSQQIIQGKLNLNQKRTLNMIIRKSINILSMKDNNEDMTHNFIKLNNKK